MWARWGISGDYWNRAKIPVYSQLKSVLTTTHDTHNFSQKVSNFPIHGSSGQRNNSIEKIICWVSHRLTASKEMGRPYPQRQGTQLCLNHVSLENHLDLKMRVWLRPWFQLCETPGWYYCSTVAQISNYPKCESINGLFWATNFV